MRYVGHWKGYRHKICQINPSMNLKSFLYASCGFFLIFCLLLKIWNGCFKYYVTETRTPIPCINCLLYIHSGELYTQFVQLNFIVLSHGQCCLMITHPHPHEVIIVQQTYMQKKKWTVILCSFVRDCSWWCFLCVLFMFWLWNIQQKYCIQKA